MVRILKSYRKRITKHCRRLVERNPMLPAILRALVRSHSKVTFAFYSITSGYPTLSFKVWNRASFYWGAYLDKAEPDRQKNPSPTRALRCRIGFPARS